MVLLSMDILEKRLELFSAEKDYKRFFKSLTKKEVSALQSYQSYYGHLSRTQNEIDKLENKINDLRLKQNQYKKKLTQKNQVIDYLSSSFFFTCAISSWIHSDGNNIEYFILTVNVRGVKKKTCNLGNYQKIEEAVKQFYKEDVDTMKEFKRIGVIRFLTKKFRSGALRDKLLKMILKNKGDLQKLKLNRDIIFS